MLCHYAYCHIAECHVLFIVMLNVVMLSVAVLKVFILSVVMLSAVAPIKQSNFRNERVHTYTPKMVNTNVNIIIFVAYC